MTLQLEQIRKDLIDMPFINDLVCFVIFGSSVYFSKTANDTDLCIVVKDRKTDLKPIATFIYKNFSNPDFTIYFEDEVNSYLPFRDIGTGIFALEYLSNGIFLYGDNIFSEKLKQIDATKYKDTILEKIFDYILRLRIVYFSQNKDTKYKIEYFKKYLLRLIISILLYLEYKSYLELSKMSNIEIIYFCIEKNIILKNTKPDFENLEKMFDLFQEINIFIINKKNK